MKLTTNIPKERLLFVENETETTAYRKGDKVKLVIKRGKSRQTMTGTIHKINDASIELDTCGLGALTLIMFDEIDYINPFSHAG